MTTAYQRLTYKNRVAIYYFIKQGLSQREMARQLGVSPSTVSREIARNQTGKSYFPEIAQHKARDRWFKQTPKLVHNSALRRAVIQRLRKQWSPEQISADLKRAYTDPAMQLSAETIYTYLYVLPRGALREELIRHLRQGHTRRRKRGNGNQSHAPIPDIISIHERPPEVEDRTIAGHWEGDLIVGERQQTALGILVERTTRTTLLIRVRKRDAETVRKAFARRIKCLPKQMRLSMTYDRAVKWHNTSSLRRKPE